jgi:glycogen debranching enzyme
VRGREALLAALLALPLQPRIAVDTLRLLARHQPKRDDARRGLAAGQIPHLLDGATTAPADLGAALETTPLWLALLGETVAWTGDGDLLDELSPAMRRAVGWMRRAALHGGYLRVGAPGVAADRPDAAGAPAPGTAPLAPQVYIYMACMALARVLCRRGTDDERAWPKALEMMAELLRRRMERDFWVGRHGCYAPALDRSGRPVGGVTSAAAYALWGGLASRPRVERVAGRLNAPDMLTGWGLRSRSAADPAYDPFGASTGSIWPHETALAAAGYWRAGGHWAGPKLARSFFAAAAAQLDGHLAERHAGDVRSGAHLAAPRPCPGASMPAAVAAASPFALLGAMLGLEPDGLAGRLIVRPSLPHWLNGVQVRHLRVGAGYVDLELRRVGLGGNCEVDWQVTDGEVEVVSLPADEY